MAAIIAIAPSREERLEIGARRKPALRIPKTGYKSQSTFSPSVSDQPSRTEN
jgi:hypothetical protein